MSEQSSTGLGPGDRCSSWGLLETSTNFFLSTVYMFTVDSFVCGIAPLGTNLVLLTFDKPKEQGNMKASTSKTFFFTFQSFYFERTWWRLFQKRVMCTKLDIYFFFFFHYYTTNININMYLPSISTNVVSSYPVYMIQHYVIKFVNDLWLIFIYMYS
jgi:hypothetical protein